MTFLNLKEYTKNLTLLYVEDDKNTREEFGEILNVLFNNVVVAIDGLDGLEKFKSNDIDLIITDINMPKMNGVKMTEQIMLLDKEANIIILSAHNESKYLIDTIKLKVAAFLLKPLSTQQFTTTLFEVVKEINQKKYKNSPSS